MNSSLVVLAHVFVYSLISVPFVLSVLLIALTIAILAAHKRDIRNKQQAETFAYFKRIINTVE